MHFLKPNPGTYALILKSNSNAKILVGHSLEVILASGYYVYIGSAFGPGGLKARVLRHLRKTKSRHWHIDYLREFVTPVEVWYSYDLKRLEHGWAKALLDMNGMYPVKGFGCTDCKCVSHLFWSKALPEFKRFSNVLKGNLTSEPLMNF